MQGFLSAGAGFTNITSNRMSRYIITLLLTTSIFNILLNCSISFAASNSISDTLDLSKLYSSDIHSTANILLAHSNTTSLPILLSHDSAYSFQFFRPAFINGNRTDQQRLLVILSTLFNTTVIWIANRDHPASANASLLLELPSRRLTLREGNGTLIWSPPVQNISAIVMNSTGNLYILADSATGSGSAAAVEWQSFDAPTDVFVPGQRLHTNHTSTASLAWNNWASGHYTLSANPGGAVLYATFDAQQTMVPYNILNYITSNTSLAGSLYSACNHTTVLYNQDASGVTLEQEGPISQQCLVEDINSVRGIDFATRMGGDGYRFLRVMPTGDINSFFLSNSTGLSLDNELFRGFYSTYCRLPSYCGVNSLCSSVQNCTCPQLFEAIDSSDPTQGCRLQTPLNCAIFRQHQFLRVDGSADYYANAYLPPRATVQNPTDCTDICLQNCSCTAAFYNNETGACHLYDQLRTMQYGSNPSVTAFLRVASLPPSDQGNDNGPFTRKVIIGVSVPAAVVLVIMVGVIGWITRRLMKARSDDDSDSEEEAFLEGLPGLPPRFSYKELYDATEGFSKQLGKGGSGAVYEGNLHFAASAAADKDVQETRSKQQQQQVKVAVKELTLSEYSSIAAASKRHFRAEVATLGNLSHVNLVQLKGFCAEGLRHRLIIYEYMENGSLDQWIFPGSSKTASDEYVLSWEVRYRIAVDTARGLAFLHEESRERVVHLDVKPQNILLDGGFRAKLADFGLSKLMERGHSQTVTAMRGTPGYMAPEWFLNLPITDRSDVFSYGMVLLELVGGRKNLNTAAPTSEEWYFPAWALKQAGSGCIREVVDKRLRAQVMQYSQQNMAQAAAVNQTAATGLLKMERLINVAFWCIQEDATSRPSMTTVVLMLEEHVQVPDPPLEMAYVPRRGVQAAGRRTAFNIVNTSSSSYTSSTAAQFNSSSCSGAAPEVTSILSPR